MGASLAYILSLTWGEKPYTDLTVHEVCEEVRSGGETLLLDVRTLPEYYGKLGRLDNSVLIPDAELASRIGEIGQYKDAHVIVYCRSGHRSVTASYILAQNGFTNVSNMLGGIRSWNGQDPQSLPCKETLRVSGR